MKIKEVKAMLEYVNKNDLLQACEKIKATSNG